jgi:hypothetical protein
VWVRQVRVSPAGEAEYSSGSLHLTLEPGRFYAVGVAWGTDQIGFGLESRPLPVEWELGTLEGYLADSAWPPNIGVLRHVGTGSICPMTLCFVDGGAISYDVYLGRPGETPVQICADAAEPVCPLPGPLDYRTLYLWKVIAGNTCQQQTGDEWSFTTGGCGQNPPTLDGTPGYGALLRRWHGQAGAFDVDLLAPAGSGGVAIECRTSPAARMVLHFTRPIQALNGSPADDVRLIDGMGAEVPIANIAVAGNELTLDVGPLADGYYRLTLPGIADAGDPDCLVPDTLCFAVLAGDVDAGGKINAFDLTRVRVRFLATASASNFRFDVNADGLIDAYDLVEVRSYMGHVLTGDCP